MLKLAAQAQLASNSAISRCYLEVLSRQGMARRGPAGRPLTPTRVRKNGVVPTWSSSALPAEQHRAKGVRQMARSQSGGRAVSDRRDGRSAAGTQAHFKGPSWVTHRKIFSNKWPATAKSTRKISKHIWLPVTTGDLARTAGSMVQTHSGGGFNT